MNRRNLFKLLFAAPVAALLAPLVKAKEPKWIPNPEWVESPETVACVWELWSQVPVMDADGNYPDESWAWTPTYKWRKSTHVEACAAARRFHMEK